MNRVSEKQARVNREKTASLIRVMLKRKKPFRFDNFYCNAGETVTGERVTGYVGAAALAWLHLDLANNFSLIKARNIILKDFMGYGDQAEISRHWAEPGLDPWDIEALYYCHSEPAEILAILER